MSGFDSVEKVLTKKLSGLDEDILSYLVAAVDGMSMNERKSSQSLFDTIGPFLVDSGFSDDEDMAQGICNEIAVMFGGSGLKSHVLVEEPDDDVPVLLSAPVKMINNAEYSKENLHVTEAFAVSDQLFEASSTLSKNSIIDSKPLVHNYNEAMDAKAIPTTQREMRKQRKVNEQLQKMLRAEAMARAKAEAEMAAARMAAIKASRTQGRQANTGVNIERFSLPHPTGTGDLLTDASLVLTQGHRYGLVGKNGAGKTTLLNAIANYKLPGLMHLRILLVDQHVEGDDYSALDWVLRADVERCALLEEESKLNSYIHGEVPLPPELKGVNLEVALAECYDRMETIGVPTSEMRARKILKGLGFLEDMITRPTNSLSGGWAMRAALAAAIFVKPNLLLLDEPTNHLDLHALVWLEYWLTNFFEGIALIVSHDKVFLNEVCTDMLELKSTLAGSSKSTFTHFNGDYNTYENTVKENKINQQRLRDSYEKEKEKLQEFISREGKKYDNPQHQSQRKMKMKQLEKLTEVEKIEEETELILKFPKPYGVFDKKETLISSKDVSFGWYPETSTKTSGGLEVLPEENILFKNVDFTLNSGSRIAIVGKNGSGKTCLLNILAGSIDPTQGNVKRHLGTRITVLHQHHYKGEQLDPNLSPLDHLRRLPCSESTAIGIYELGTRQEESAHRSYLANFGVVGPRSTIPVKYLSGGQRMRVAMAIAFYRKPDIIILDEPTNHLDAETVHALCEALKTFEGAIITVSHDESYINNVISSAVVGDEESKKDGTALNGELWVLSKKKVQRFDGSFNDYKKEVLKKLSMEEFQDLFSKV